MHPRKRVLVIVQHLRACVRACLLVTNWLDNLLLEWSVDCSRPPSPSSKPTVPSSYAVGVSSGLQRHTPNLPLCVVHGVLLLCLLRCLDAFAQGNWYAKPFGVSPKQPAVRHAVRTRIAKPGGPGKVQPCNMHARTAAGTAELLFRQLSGWGLGV